MAQRCDGCRSSFHTGAYGVDVMFAGIGISRLTGCCSVTGSCSGSRIRRRPWRRRCFPDVMQHSRTFRDPGHSSAQWRFSTTRALARAVVADHLGRSFSKPLSFGSRISTTCSGTPPQISTSPVGFFTTHTLWPAENASTMRTDKPAPSNQYLLALTSSVPAGILISAPWDICCLADRVVPSGGIP
jgi:hypothetical protein